MRPTTPFAVALAFAAGLLAPPFAEHAFGEAHAQAAPLAPMMTDLVVFGD